MTRLLSIQIFCAFFVRSKRVCSDFCAFMSKGSYVQIFVRSSMFPDRVNLHTRRPLVRSFWSGHIKDWPGTSAWMATIYDVLINNKVFNYVQYPKSRQAFDHLMIMKRLPGSRFCRKNLIMKRLAEKICNNCGKMQFRKILHRKALATFSNKRGENGQFY